MSNEIAIDDRSPVNPSVCERCGCSYDLLSSLRELMDEGVKVFVDGSYCVDCTKIVSKEVAEKERKQYKREFTEALERMKEGKTFDAHEKMMDKIVEHLEDPKFRKGEYIYDVTVLAMSLVMLAETEMKNISYRMDKLKDDEPRLYSLLVGKMEMLGDRLSAWMTEANDVFSDFSVYSSKNSIAHLMDEDED